MAITTNLRVIAAICGNWWQESTVNPGIWEGLTPNAPGYGLGQWTDNPPNVMRKTALFNWLSANGYAQGSGEGQLEFLVYEDLWIPSLFVASQYATLGDFFNSTSTSLHDCVLEFMYHWEGIDDGTDAVRLAAAQRYYDLFVNDPGTRGAWTSGNYYCSQAQADNNALLIKDFLMGSSPTPSLTDDEILAITRQLLRKRRNGGMILVF